MRAAAVLAALMLAWAPAAYVRREWIPPGSVSYVVAGSRDRTLAGKARIRARRAA